MSYIRASVVSLLLFSFIVVPASASAASFSDLFSQLKAVQAQLQQIKKQQVLGVSTSTVDAVQAVSASTTVSLSPIWPPYSPAVGKDNDLPLSWLVYGVPKEGAVIETEITFKKATDGSVTGVGTKNTYYTSVSTWAGTGRADYTVDLANYVPGTYSIRSRMRTCNTSGCDTLPPGKNLTSWGGSGSFTVEDGSTVGEGAINSVRKVSAFPMHVKSGVVSYQYKIAISAAGGDVYIPVVTASTTNSTLKYTITGSSYKGPKQVSVRSTNNESNGYIVIKPSYPNEVVIEIALDPDQDGSYGTELTSIQYAGKPGGALRTYKFASGSLAISPTSISGSGGIANSDVAIRQKNTSAEVDTGVGKYKIDLDITALDSDIHIGSSASSPWTSAVRHDVYGDQFSGNITSTLQSTAPLSNGYFQIMEGETKRVTLYSAVSTTKKGTYGIVATALSYKTSSTGSTQTLYFPPFAGSPDSIKTNTILLPGGIATSSVATTTVSATINSKSLASKTANPKLAGKATGVSTVGISIDNGDKVYGSSNIRVKNGKWSHTVSTELENGEYTVVVYGPNNVELTRGKLVVNKPE